MALASENNVTNPVIGPTGYSARVPIKISTEMASAAVSSPIRFSDPNNAKADERRST
jgi:hypothetical protein